MIEVLITLLVLMFGLLGLASLQSKMQVSQFESYQTAQALSLLADMTDRMNANTTGAANYVTSSPALGVDDTSQPANCSTVTGVARDKCEWSKALQGAAETSGSTKYGAMIGARGCITNLQAATNSTATPSCQPAIYQVTLTWQSMAAVKWPSTDQFASFACPGTPTADNYSTQRILSSRVVVKSNLSGC
jgi:type IV pilus assembly protein PilV